MSRPATGTGTGWRIWRSFPGRSGRPRCRTSALRVDWPASVLVEARSTGRVARLSASRRPTAGSVTVTAWLSTTIRDSPLHHRCRSCALPRHGARSPAMARWRTGMPFATGHFDTVCANPHGQVARPGDAGQQSSFFKISGARRTGGVPENRNTPRCPLSGGEGWLLAAGWPIDQSAGRGFATVAPASPSEQALVLVNLGVPAPWSLPRWRARVRDTVANTSSAWRWNTRCASWGAGRNSGWMRCSHPDTRQTDLIGLLSDGQFHWRTVGEQSFGISRAAVSKAHGGAQRAGSGSFSLDRQGYRPAVPMALYDEKLKAAGRWPPMAPVHCFPRSSTPPTSTGLERVNPELRGEAVRPSARPPGGDVVANPGLWLPADP